MSVICSRISGVLRSSDIRVTDVSTPLDMTKDQRVRCGVTKTFDVGHRGALFECFSFVHSNSERFLDFARNDKECVGCDEFRNF